MSARQLGHSVVVAEKHYTGVLRVSRDARTLDDAMRVAADVEPSEARPRDRVAG